MTIACAMINERGFLTRACEARFATTSEGRHNLEAARQRALRERDARADAKRNVVAPRRGFFEPTDQQRQATQDANDKRKAAIHSLASSRNDEKNQSIIDATGQFADEGRRRLKEKLDAELRFLDAPAESWATFLSGNVDTWRRDQEDRGLAPMEDR